MLVCRGFLIEQTTHHLYIPNTSRRHTCIATQVHTYIHILLLWHRLNHGTIAESREKHHHLPATSLHYCTAECDVVVVAQLHNGSIKLGQVNTRSIWTWASIAVRHVGYRADNPSSRILESVLVHTYIEVIYHTYTTTYIHIHTSFVIFSSIGLFAACRRGIQRETSPLPLQKQVRSGQVIFRPLDCIGQCDIVVVTQRRLWYKGGWVILYIPQKQSPCEVLFVTTYIQLHTNPLTTYIHDHNIRTKVRLSQQYHGTG
jgi:hypothetical protein